jgi:hypothetical protein
VSQRVLAIHGALTTTTSCASVASE